MRFIIVLLTLFALFSGCEKQAALSTFSGQAMTMQYRVLIGSYLNSQQKKEVDKIISETFSYIDTVFNKWNPDSEISKLNGAKAGKKILLSQDLEKHLVEIDSLHKLTNGLFDPTVEPLLTMWQNDPEQAEMTATAVGWDKVHIKDHLFWKTHDLTSLDLGGIAKGLAIDIMVDRLNSSGFPDVYFEWGGEIKTSGKHPGDRPWQVLIKENDTIIQLENEAVATSGDYYQNWKIGDVTYTHIIDPIKKRPLEITPESITSVTVKAKSCMFADAIATSAMLLPTKEKAEIWLKSIKEKYPDIDFWVFVKKPHAPSVSKQKLIKAES